MQRTLVFLTGFLDYPRGSTIVTPDRAMDRVYRHGRGAARRLRHRAAVQCSIDGCGQASRPT